ncbi:MAG: hypothetical protein HYZ74_02200, partial [Elusimicrobia bacterium]|nr:hypothetical protein [Elusimicrobiota bacterium]
FGPGTAIALRTGWRFNSPSDRLPLGIGLREGRYSLDYALNEKQSLGQIHHASFGVRF